MKTLKRHIGSDTGLSASLPTANGFYWGVLLPVPLVRDAPPDPVEVLPDMPPDAPVRDFRLELLPDFLPFWVVLADVPERVPLMPPVPDMPPPPVPMPPLPAPMPPPLAPPPMPLDWPDEEPPAPMVDEPDVLCAEALTAKPMTATDVTMILAIFMSLSSWIWTLNARPRAVGS